MKRPNIVLISIDTLRADHLSCYGYHRRTSPNIDRIAAEGVRFEQAYSNAVWTPPSHASMLSGLYPSQHGVTDNTTLSKSLPTIAETLLKAGYDTAGFVNNPLVGAMVGLDRGHEQFFEMWRGVTSGSRFVRACHYLYRRLRDAAGVNDHGGLATNQKVQQWLQQRTKSDKPFYLFLHHIEPHNPIAAPRPFRYKFVTPDVSAAIDRNKLAKMANNPLCYFTQDITLTETERSYLIGLYDGEIAYVDHLLGQLINYLREMNRLDNTLLIVTADHGEHLGEHDFYSHVASLYEPIVRIPVIIRYPELYEPGTVVDGPVQTVDIFPTILQAIGQKHSGPLPLQGTSLAPVQGRVQIDKERPIIAEWEGRIPKFVKSRSLEQQNGVIQRNAFMSVKLKMVRQGRFKYILSEDGNEQLYDLRLDAEERCNIADANSEQRRRLRQHLALLDNDQEFAAKVSETEIDADLEARLKGLGYL